MWPVQGGHVCVMQVYVCNTYVLCKGPGHLWASLQLYVCCLWQCIPYSTWHDTQIPSYDLSILSFQTIQKVCPICSKCVLETVVVQYDLCRCIRRMCQDCDAELEKSEIDRCKIHSFSIRDTQRKGKKTRTTWPFNSLASVDCTELPFDVQYVY